MRRRHVFVAILSVMALTALVLAGCSSEDSPTDPNGGDPAGAAIWYVDIDAMGTGDGKSWDNAFEHPSDAMAAASSGDQIWVADGRYFGPGDRTVPVVAFKENISMYGGFVGGETDLSQRDMANRAVFDGGDSLYHVVTGAEYTLLHGFHIWEGNASGTGDISEQRGGGIYCYNVKMRISNCQIDDNEAGLGGGVYAENDTIVIDSCMFVNNHATNVELTAAGGGAINIFTGAAAISDCTIRENTSGTEGGGILVYRGKIVVKDSEISSNSTLSTNANGGGVLLVGETSRPADYLVSEFTSCRFTDNMSGYGGAVRATDTSPRFTDCEFEDNDAGMIGAALYGWASSFLMEHCILESNGVTAVSANQPQGTFVNPRIFNCLFIFNGDIDTDGGAIRNSSVDIEIECCTFVGNNARNGGGISNTGTCSPVITNCILWSNTASGAGDQIHDTSGATSVVTYTDIDQTGFDGGTGNLRSDPLFVAGSRGDYYLSQIAAGQGSTSPCVDAGSNTAVYFLLHTMTTMTSNVVDAGQVDLGFHYELDN